VQGEGSEALASGPLFQGPSGGILHKNILIFGEKLTNSYINYSAADHK